MQPIQMPFTEQEMFGAFRLVMSDEEARELASAWGRRPEEIAAGESIGWGLNDDTLVLLSLSSEAVRERAEALLNRIGSPWQESREQMRRWLIDTGRLPDAPRGESGEG